MSSNTGLFRASVFDTKDPQRRGRLRLYVPQVLGSEPSGWAEPTVKSSGEQYKVKDRMWVMFEGGDLNRPTYMARPTLLPEDISDEVLVRITGGRTTPWSLMELEEGWTPAPGFTEPRYRVKNGLLTTEGWAQWDVANPLQTPNNTILTTLPGLDITSRKKITDIYLDLNDATARDWNFVSLELDGSILVAWPVLPGFAVCLDGSWDIQV